MSPDTVLPEPEEKAARVEEMFDRIAGRYDRMNRLLTLRLDVRWRKAAVREVTVPRRSTVLDLACGTGDFCNDLAAAGFEVVGFDFSAGMLGNATTSAPLVRADVLRLPVPDASIDAITCGFALRNLIALDPFFVECARVLRPGGRLVLLDVGEPKSRLVRFGHGLYFRKIVPFIGGLLSDRAAYSYLPASTAYLPPPEQLVEQVRAAGFRGVLYRRFLFGTAQMIAGSRA